MTRNDAASTDTPYADLGPDTVLDAIESLGLATDGRVLALNSYENRVYRVGLDGAAPLIAKFYRPGRWSDAGIAEEHRFSTQLRDADLSVVAPQVIGDRSLHHHAGHRFAVFPMQGGHAPELERRETLQQLGRTLARMHGVGARERFRHRHSFDLATFGHAPVRFLRASDWLPQHLAASFARLSDALLDQCVAAWARAGDVATLRLHGDCHPGNILWRDGQAHFVDLDDCGSGPAVQDLWMLLSGGAEEQRRQLECLLEGYGEFRDFDWRERHLIEPLRTLRLLHYHAWIARRWHDPAFPHAFPWFSEPRHWERVVVQMQEQLAALQEPIFD